jgi:TPP-dependent pyruvate/acetoin dehydrogenase alpha subunit
MYREMLTIRAFDEACYEQFNSDSSMRYAGIHGYIGQEAIAVGVCSALRKGDKITSTHRGHGHLIAMGADPKLMMAEIQGKSTGYNKGKGGTMHIVSFDLGILGANGVVGAGIPIATGAAFAIRYKQLNQVCICFFGDSAANEGVFNEGLNLASIWKLPVVFVCENNQYAVHTPMTESTSVADISVRAAGYSIPGVTVDGNDVLKVYDAAYSAIERAREGGGPSLIECKTYRVMPHHGNMPDYRPPDEKEAWKAKDPIKRFEGFLVRSGLLDEEKKTAIAREVADTIQTAVKFARESQWPDPKEAYQDVYA